MDVLAQNLSGRERELSLPQPFCSIQVFSGLTEAHPQQKGHLLYSVYQFQCQAHPETPSQMYREILFSLGTPWPLGPKDKINCHRNSATWNTMMMDKAFLSILSILIKAHSDECFGRKTAYKEGKPVSRGKSLFQ